jgi:hypothetical protein
MTSSSTACSTDMTMRRKPLAKTVQRGYGIEHKRLRARLLATYQPTDPCARCGWPLGPDRDQVQLGHRDGQVGYNGLEHRRCNVAAANKRRAALARAQGLGPRRRRPRPSRAQVEPGAWVIPQRPHARRW